MERRDFIRLGAVGLFGIAATAAVARSPLPGLLGLAIANSTRTFDLTVSEALVEMVDETPVYMWLYDAGDGPTWPGPVLIAHEGDVITVNVTNELDEPHAWTLPGICMMGPIAPGDTTEATFIAPLAGTYLYADDLQGPVNRVLGLHGAFISKPHHGELPYSSPTSQVQRLFDDFGVAETFPGQPWSPVRDWLWIFQNVDPSWNALAEAGQPIDVSEFERTFLARYFAVNGKSGYWSDHDPTIGLHGYVGQPALVRCVNAGMAVHSPHWHGNHVYWIAENGVVRDNVLLLDTLALKPLDCHDIVFPFTVPPDVPDAAWPPVEEQFPLMYPMHCHNEPSQTAAGGNYAQGIIAHLVFFGPGPGGPILGPGDGKPHHMSHEIVSDPQIVEDALNDPVTDAAAGAHDH